MAPPLTTQTADPVLVVRALEFSTQFADVFQIEVINTESSKWRGAVVDTTTGKRVHIGSWTLPASTKGIKGGQEGFIECFSWNDGQNRPCSSSYSTSFVFHINTPID